MKVMKLQTGISKESCTELAKGLSGLLADTYSLYLKTQNYHWNVTGPNFQSLHTMFETQYTELAMAIDEIAERIRALGVRAPGSYEEFSKLSSIKTDSNKQTANEMVQDLLESHEKILSNARSFFPSVEQAHDAATADILTQRMQYHEKTAWMLRATLEQ